MTTAAVLDREEYVEQAYFFRTFRERLADNLPAQDILTRLNEELLSSTRLPYAVQFLAAELKHTGLLASGFARVPHYFTAFQAFVIGQAEQENSRLPMTTALLVLEREAAYRAEKPTRPGLFVYQFEAIARNRLGYLDGFTAMTADPLHDENWRTFIGALARQVGDVDFADLVYLRSELYVMDESRADPAFVPSLPPLFGVSRSSTLPPARRRGSEARTAGTETPRAGDADQARRERASRQRRSQSIR
jgi:hypothetical protein